MNRYLFRGKRVDNGEWVQGSLCVASEKAFIVTDCDFYETKHCGDYSLTADRYFKVDPKTVGQYIGKKDKSSKKMFKGDKVLFTYGKHYNEPKGLTRIGTIVYDVKDVAFEVAIDDSAVKVRFRDITRTEVIGNIHESEVS